MKVSPLKVVELLGSELLELLYVGTEDMFNGSGGSVHESQQMAEPGLELHDASSQRIYDNLREVREYMKPGGYKISYEDLGTRFLGKDIYKETLSHDLKMYINGLECVNSSDPEDEGAQSSCDAVDRSLKGSVDVLLIPLLRLFLRTGRFISTSCCSGRIVLFESNPEHARMATKRSKEFGRAGRFLYSSHCHITDVDFEGIVQAFNAKLQTKHDIYKKEPTAAAAAEAGDPDVENAGFVPGQQKDFNVILKFEPFVLHVECQNMEDATELLQICRGCGLKQSGIISCSKRIILSICGKTILEAPVAIRHYQTDLVVVNNTKKYVDKLLSTKWLISNPYLLHLIAVCNRKLSASNNQLLRLYWTCVRKFGINPLQPFVLATAVTPRQGRKTPRKDVEKPCDTPKAEEEHAETSCYESLSEFD